MSDGVRCEAGGCTEALEARRMRDGKGEELPWEVATVVPGWHVARVRNLDKGGERMVVLCPVHGAGLERTAIQ